MAVNTVRFVQPRQSITNNAFSDSIWGNVPLESLRDGAVPGCLLEFDFTGFKRSTNVNAADAYWSDGFYVFGSDGAPIADADIVGGGVTISSDGDNEGAVISQALTTFQISRTTGPVYFEARIKTSTITDAKHNIFLGLMDSTAATAAIPITATGTLADVNLVGFHRPETARTVAGTGGAIMNTVYKADTVLAVTVGTDQVTLAADTWTNLGMMFEPIVTPFNSGVGDGYGRYLLSFYQDGKLLSAQKQIPSAAGTDFPNDVRLKFVFSVLNATGSTPGTSSIDRLRIAQLFV